MQKCMGGEYHPMHSSHGSFSAHAIPCISKHLWSKNVFLSLVKSQEYTQTKQTGRVHGTIQKYSLSFSLSLLL